MEASGVKRTMSAGFTLGCLVVGSCGGGDGSSVPSVQVGDSAGVRIVDISGYANLDLPEWTIEEVYSSVEGPEFTTIVDAAFVADSILVVADQGSSQVTFLNDRGAVITRAGRRGSGPGEYTDIGRFGVGADDSLFVFDRREQRLTMLATDGTALRVERIDLGGRYLPYEPLTRLPNGGFLAALETRALVPAGLHRAPFFLVRTNEDGQVADTLGRWEGKEFFATEDGNQWLPVGFARTAVYAGRGRRTAVGTTDSLDITVWDGAQVSHRIRGRTDPKPVAREERERWIERYIEPWPDVARASARTRIEQSQIRDNYPAYGALAIDADGRLWVGAYARLTDLQRVWTVFGNDGRPIGRVNLPAYHARAVEVENSIPGFRTHELLDVRGNRVAVVRVDAFDVQYVTVFAIAEH